MSSHPERRRQARELIESLRPLENDPFAEHTGVLYSDQIKRLCSEEYTPRESLMINPFDLTKLHPAGYKLSVGTEFAHNGKVFRLGETGRPNYRPEIEIEPFEVVILRTKECLCIPQFIIARWNVVVKLAYKGLLWVGGPQVDPGWRGPLCCPIYNLSGKTVVLREGDDIALMDFVKTTPVPTDYLQTENPRKYELYPVPDRIVIEDYDTELESGLVPKRASE